MDSSDEEWDNAYVAMDPISQLGWGNRCVEVDGAATQLVRDVFVAADVVHEDAMSEAAGSTHDEGEGRGSMEDAAEDTPQSPTEGSMYAASSEEGDVEGERNYIQAFNAVNIQCRRLKMALGGDALDTLSICLRCYLQWHPAARSS